MIMENEINRLMEESEQKYLEKFLRPILYQWTKEGELIELAP